MDQRNPQPEGGTLYRRGLRNSAQSSIYNGSISFNRDTNNPLDSNNAYSNALLGIVDSYTESNGKVGAHMRYHDIEWFFQDSWKVSKRLTLDLGLRFQRISPSYGKQNNCGEFLPAAYLTASSAQLIQPQLSGGVRVG